MLYAIELYKEYSDSSFCESCVVLNIASISCSVEDDAA